MSAPVIVIRFDDTGEHRVPGPDGSEAQAYYASDREDAIDTAREIYGAGAVLRFRRCEYCDPDAEATA